MRSLMLSIGISAVLLGGCARNNAQEAHTVGTTGSSEYRDSDSADTAIKSEVEANLSALPELAAEMKSGRVEVDTDNGTVELDGTVDSETELAEAISMAWSVAGVTEVEDDLRVRQ